MAIDQARDIVAGWIGDDGNECPQFLLGYATPAAFVAELEQQRAGLTPPVASSAVMRDDAGRFLIAARRRRGSSHLNQSLIDDRYRVTYKFLDIAYRATPAQRLTTAALPEMQALALSAGQSCHLVVVEGGSGLVIAREENPGTRGFALRVGASIDIITSCSGKVLLAFSSKTEMERVVSRAEAKQAGPVGRARLLSDIERIQVEGYDLRKSPITRGVTDISYPIFGFGGECLAALTIPFLETIDGSQAVMVDEARMMLSQTVANISRQLGYRSEV